MTVLAPDQVEALRAALAAIVGDAHVLTTPEDVIAYGFDGTFFANTPPLVVLPGSTAEIAAIHRLANERRIALTPRAMGSGLSGGSVPLAGSIVLGIARLNRILAIDPIDRVAVVQAGVITATLQAAVEKIRAAAATLLLAERGLMESPLKGPKGNVEFLLRLAAA